MSLDFKSNNLFEFQKEINASTSILFIRNSNKSELINNYFPSQLHSFLGDLKTLSEYKNGDFYINYFDIEINCLTNQDWSIIANIIKNYDEIILRCRGLRDVDYKEAKNIVWQTFKFFIDFFSTNTEVKSVYSTTVDSFIMDIMVRVARHFEIKVISFVRFFVSGYYRVSIYGETNYIRNVTEDEIESVFSVIVSDEKSFMAISRNQLLISATENFLKKKIKYLLTYLLNYKVLGNLEWRNKFSDSKRGFVSLKQILPIFKFVDVSKVKFTSKSIFIPLHYYPEATVDYWLDDIEYVDYENSVIKVCSILSNAGYQVIIKEHPAFVFSRKNKFYDSLRKIESVVLVDPFSNSKILMKQINKIVIWTGSAGLEGLMKGKEVYSVAENYYSFKKLPRYTKLLENDFIYPQFNLKNILENVMQGTILIEASND